MICGAGTSSGGGASPGGRLGILSVRSSQSPPPRRASIVWRCRHARRAPRHDRLRGLNAALPQPASQ